MSVGMPRGRQSTFGSYCSRDDGVGVLRMRADASPPSRLLKKKIGPQRAQRAQVLQAK
jgi:hypothetical protein